MNTLFAITRPRTPRLAVVKVIHRSVGTALDSGTFGDVKWKIEHRRLSQNGCRKQTSESGNEDDEECRTEVGLKTPSSGRKGSASAVGDFPT